MKVKINSVNITVMPLQNYRTTKGGKRILKGDPAISVNITLGIDLIPSLQAADMVLIEGQLFIYFPQKQPKSAYLRNVTNSLTKSFTLNTSDVIEIETIGSMYAEGQREQPK